MTCPVKVISPFATAVTAWEMHRLTNRLPTGTRLQLALGTLRDPFQPELSKPRRRTTTHMSTTDAYPVDCRRNVPFTPHPTSFDHSELTGLGIAEPHLKQAKARGRPLCFFVNDPRENPQARESDIR